ncbi:MAG: hypothetical protein QF578_04085 [Alphaproteobacteria bacterium]|nr:hypothetical protein [Alphaproteobacteria bacterium]MDP6563981.1 hypothetical protein [Alphaproteobacteria bacterium]MDP6814729.1 hypothetical protein [Alphaproteobacteria bacterium]
MHAHGIEAARLYWRGELAGALNEVGLVAEPSVAVVKNLDELIAR